jgi:hypothetical protein
MINKLNAKFTALLNRRLTKVGDNACEYRAYVTDDVFRGVEKRSGEWCGVSYPEQFTLQRNGHQTLCFK